MNEYEIFQYLTSDFLFHQQCRRVPQQAEANIVNVWQKQQGSKFVFS